MTNSVYDTYKPPGFHTVSAYLGVSDPPPLIDFLKQAFYASELNRTVNDDGVLTNCILQIGDSCFMVSRPMDGVAMPTMFYLFVEDPDGMHDRAVAHGAVSVMNVDDQRYGDRQGGVRDCAGNYWWISKRIKAEPYAPY